MIGAGTFINPLLKILTTVGILAAAYFFIISPILDTTEEVSSGFNDSIGKSLESTNDQIDRALDQAEKQSSQSFAVPQTSSDSLKEANKLLDCIQRANQDVEKLQKCSS
jgi:hypothetical protein